MAFDIAQIDAVLSTTRAVRLRLDLERQVPDEIITGASAIRGQHHQPPLVDHPRPGGQSADWPFVPRGRRRQHDQDG